jgi:hypothetical protein
MRLLNRVSHFHTLNSLLRFIAQLFTCSVSDCHLILLVLLLQLAALVILFSAIQIA